MNVIRLQEIINELAQYVQELQRASSPIVATPFERDVITQLRRDEGEMLHAYQDSLGYWTIGIGVLIDKRKGGVITREESEMLFFNRLHLKLEDLDKNLPWWRDLDSARQGVLLNMTYQMGISGLLGFVNTLRMVKEGKYEEASKGMLQSKWAAQTPERARRLSDQMKDGQWR